MILKNLWMEEPPETRADKYLFYFDIYERQLARFIGWPMRMLEIGVQRGGSLRMWKKYFGGLSTVVGVDIDPSCKKFDEPSLPVRIGDQADTKFLADVVAEFGPFDLVIDDGSHNQGDVRATFHYLYPRLSLGGVYLVEDLHCAYWEKHEGGFGRPGTFIEYEKSLLDELHVPSNFRDITLAMHVYPWLTFFERGCLEIPT